RIPELEARRRRDARLDLPVRDAPHRDPAIRLHGTEPLQAAVEAARAAPRLLRQAALRDDTQVGRRQAGDGLVAQPGQPPLRQLAGLLEVERAADGVEPAEALAGASGEAAEARLRQVGAPELLGAIGLRPLGGVALPPQARGGDRRADR